MHYVCYSKRELVSQIKIINQANRMKSKAKKMTSGKTVKRTRGYRLKPATHRLISKLSEMLEADQDEVISKACRKYYGEVRKIIAGRSYQTKINI